MQTPPATSRRVLRAAEESRRRTRPPLAWRKRAVRRARPPIRRQLFGAVAMAFVALLAISVSLPALAVNPDAATASSPSRPTAGAPQVFSANEAATVTVLRDGFTVGRVQKALPGAYSQTAATYVNTPIQAIANGVVKEVSATDDSGLGVYAIIDHMIGGRLVSSLYAHMAKGTLALTVGQPVLVGQLVGNVGSTGQSTGPHLHFEILLDGSTPTDPFAWLTERVGSNGAN